MLDYYKLLNINKRATNDEIKKAYRVAALFWHPDKNKSEQAHQKFIDITEAYNILLDPHKRKVYDELFDEEKDIILKPKQPQYEQNRKNEKRNSYYEWIKEEQKKAEKLTFISVDKILTEGFHFIDEYGWVIFAIFMIIWFIIFLTYK